MDARFSDVVASEAELRAVIGHSSEVVAKGRLSALDHNCRAYIANCPFVIFASAQRRSSSKTGGCANRW